jgi:hypothetical protein
MYKNFKLTEEEKSQILEMHQSRGYRKPIKEQNNNDEMGNSIETSIPDPVKDLFKNYGLKLTQKRNQGLSDSGYSLIFDLEQVPFDVKFKDGILTLKLSDYGDNVLKNHLKREYNFEFNRPNIDFEIGILNDFLNRSTQILLKNREKEKIDYDDNPHLDSERRTFRSMMGGSD